MRKNNQKNSSGVGLQTTKEGSSISNNTYSFDNQGIGNRRIINSKVVSSKDKISPDFSVEQLKILDLLSNKNLKGIERYNLETYFKSLENKR